LIDAQVRFARAQLEREKVHIKRWKLRVSKKRDSETNRQKDEAKMWKRQREDDRLSSFQFTLQQGEEERKEKR